MGRVAGEQINLARGQRGKAFLGRQGHEFNLLGITEHGRRNPITDIRINTAHLARIIGGRKPCESTINPATQNATVFYVFQCPPPPAAKVAVEAMRPAQSAEMNETFFVFWVISCSSILYWIGYYQPRKR